MNSRIIPPVGCDGCIGCKYGKHLVSLSFPLTQDVGRYSLTTTAHCVRVKMLKNRKLVLDWKRRPENMPLIQKFWRWAMCGDSSVQIAGRHCETTVCSYLSGYCTFWNIRRQPLGYPAVLAYDKLSQAPEYV
jgi:hypothetical protein